MSFAKAQLAHFAARGVLDGAEANGIDRYVYVAVMDAKTSKICRELDGKVFKIADAKPFVNMPPMHINCRSGIAPYILIKKFMGYDFMLKAELYVPYIHSTLQEDKSQYGYKKWTGGFDSTMDLTFGIGHSIKSNEEFEKIKDYIGRAEEVANQDKHWQNR